MKHVRHYCAKTVIAGMYQAIEFNYVQIETLYRFIERLSSVREEFFHGLCRVIDRLYVVLANKCGGVIEVDFIIPR